MKVKAFCMAVAGAAMVLGASAPARAATSAPGPYYATPSWDQKLPLATRFVVLSNWDNKAVLDRETGLVWKLSIESINGRSYLGSLSDASFACVTAGASDRGGWRLPTIQELTRTLPSGGSDTLTADSPLAFLLGHTLWSSTGNGTDLAWTEQIWAQGYSTTRGAIVTRPAASAWCVQSPAPGAAVQ